MQVQPQVNGKAVDAAPHTLLAYGLQCHTGPVGQPRIIEDLR